LLEEIRMRAVHQMVEEGVHPDEVEEALGFARSTVYSWLAQYREGGWEALRAKPIPGRPAKLSAAQRREIAQTVAGNDPRQLQFSFALWTREMVQELIWRKFEIHLSLGGVGRLLRRLGLTPQRPLHRAYQQNPEAVERWKTTEYPQIRAEAAKVGALVYFADEAAVRSDYHSGTTWGLRGHTPVVEGTGARFSVNMISAIAPGGTLRFMVLEGTLTAPRFVEFCKRLLHDSRDRPVFLILDGHPVHRSKAVKSFAVKTEGRLRLFYLPGYSPELNPDEWVWKNVKHDRVGEARVSSKDELKAVAVRALRRLQRLPQLVRGFFQDPHLRYITAE
jgi:transposase